MEYIGKGNKHSSSDGKKYLQKNNLILSQRCLGTAMINALVTNSIYKIVLSPCRGKHNIQFMNTEKICFFFNKCD